jgi:nitrogen fixation/metabolism regulation signal transduction histidine kinase
MVYNSFQTSVLTRIGLLVVNLFALSFLYVMQDRFFTLIFLALLAILQIILLFVYLNKTNRNLARFLLLLTHEDTSVIEWKDRVEKTFRGLHHSFRKVNEEINRIRLEKEEGSILLKGIIQHVEAGIIAMNDQGKVEHINDTAMNILGVTRLEHISDLDLVREGASQVFSKLNYDSGNVIRYSIPGAEERPLLVRVSMLKLEDRTLKIFSLQDIKSELEANEIDSWQKMTRILSHEISNSVAPISTLGEGIHIKLKKGKKDSRGRLIIEENESGDLLKSSELIQQRSNGLVEFMDHYKNFSRLPDPVTGKVVLTEFFDSLIRLVSEETGKEGIRIESEVHEPGLSIMADPKLFEQAFINLIRNASEALAGREDGLIRLSAYREKEHLVNLRVSDNGPGIPEEIRSQIFIPFFTTKRGGSGIGMSIVRKVVIACGGSIDLDTLEKSGTTFVIKLPEY